MKFHFAHAFATLSLLAAGLSGAASTSTLPAPMAPSRTVSPTAGSGGLQATTSSAALNAAWQERIVGTWQFETGGTDKEGLSQSERAEIVFGKDGRYSATTLIHNPVEDTKLSAAGRYAVQPLDDSRARLALQHDSNDPEAMKEELTEVVEMVATDKDRLGFPGNATLVRIR